MKRCLCVFVGVFSVASLFFASLIWAQTPFSFVQRQDVREEINVNDAQIQLVNRLQPFCDALCQRRTRDAFLTMDADLQQQFSELDSAQRQQAIESFGQQMQESVELETLESQVLFQPQMTRFLQLWIQQAGMDALTKVSTSRQLDLSDFQITQIQNIQGIGQTAMDACRRNSQLSPQQQFIQIQNIQINMINQCSNVLSAEQAAKFVDLCGEPFVPEPGDGNNGDPRSDVAVQTESDAIDAGPAVSLSETNAPRGHSATGDGRTARPAQVIRRVDASVSAPDRSGVRSGPGPSSQPQAAPTSSEVSGSTGRQR